MKNKILILLLVILIGCTSKDRAINDIETEEICQLVDNKINYFKNVKNRRPNPRVHLYLQIIENINSSAEKILSPSLSVSELKTLIIEHQNLVKKELNFSDYVDPYEKVIQKTLQVLTNDNIDIIKRQVKFQEYFIIDYFSDNIFEGYIPLNKFYIKKNENSIFVSCNDSSKLIKVLIDTKEGVDTLKFDHQNGKYLINSKKYGELIEGKIQCININNELVEESIRIKNN